MKKYILTDSHFNHTNIIKYENRPENFKELIVNNWIDIVPADAEVYHLGDVIFKQAYELGEILAKTPGTKHLCLGNHDREKPTWFINKGFSTAHANVMNTFSSHFTKKEFAIRNMEINKGNKFLIGAVFAIANGNDISKKIWDALFPEFEKPFMRTNEEDID
jgi:calcineurin-like phosphoesterase family protein